MSFYGHFTPLICFAYSRCEHSQSQKYWKSHNYSLDMAMRRIFWGFCINRFGIGPLHQVLSRSDFVFEFAEIFVIKKRLPDLPSRGVDKNAYRYNCLKL
jgi:hypothetical protein